MLIPLKNPLENRPTVRRVMRSMGIDLSQRQIEYASGEIFCAFDGTPTKVNQRTEKGSYAKKVCCYPVEYIPKMREIIQKYADGYVFEKKKKERKPKYISKITISEKKKRPRIKK